MNINRRFLAENWLSESSPQKDLLNKGPAELINNANDNASQDEFKFTSFLTPGWTGGSLISKSALNVKNSIKILHIDALTQFNDINKRNASLKRSIFEDFLFFLKDQSINFDEIHDYKIFWKHIDLKNNSPYYKTLSQFIDEYCHRVVDIYLLKIRFILKLSEQLQTHLPATKLLNPNSYINNFFLKGSRYEFDSEALQINLYSWFRPQNDLQSLIVNISNSLSKISITELVKTLSDRQTINSLQTKSDFSHSFSNKHFGHFLNLLLVYFPDLSKKTLTSYANSEQEVISTKFTGDYLSSMGMSQLHDMHNQKNHKWPKIIVPHLHGQSFNTSKYLKISHELIYLTLLIDIAEGQKQDTLNFISYVMRNKNQVIPNSDQMHLFQNTDPSIQDTSYHRIILNLVNTPKTNPYHNLQIKINKELENLSSNGLILLFTDQKLFVDSQRDRLEQILSNLKLEGIFNLEDMKGKGKIPNFLYILKKRSLPTYPKGQTPYYNNTLKETCYTFKISGVLETFCQFSKVNDFLENFFHNTKNQMRPLQTVQLSNTLNLTYHVDAIIDKRFLSSMVNTKNNITHPTFFRNITNNCIPFDQFFNIQILKDSNNNDQEWREDSLLGFSIDKQKKFKLCLIVNYEESSKVKLELIRFDAYKAKKEKYGVAFFFYFGLSPKYSNININALREFFISEVGNQIIQISFNSNNFSVNKVKSALKSLLIPNFLLESSEITDSVKENLSLLFKDATSLKQQDPHSVIRDFSNIEVYLQEVIGHYPAKMIELLSYFKNNLYKIKQGDLIDSSYDNLSSPYFFSIIKNLELKSIFPKNSDIYIDFSVKNNSDLYRLYQSLKLNKDLDSPYLELFSAEQVSILKIYSDINMLNFLAIIFQRTQGHSFIELLQNIKVPALDQLNKSITTYQESQQSYNLLYNKVAQIIPDIISKKVIC